MTTQNAITAKIDAVLFDAARRSHQRETQVTARYIARQTKATEAEVIAAVRANDYRFNGTEISLPATSDARITVRLSAAIIARAPLGALTIERETKTGATVAGDAAAVLALLDWVDGHRARFDTKALRAARRRAQTALSTAVDNALDAEQTARGDGREF